MSSRSRELVIAGASVAIVVVTSIVFEGHFQGMLRQRNEELQRQAGQMARLESENERLSNLVAHIANTEPSANRPSDELLRLRGEVGVLREQTSELQRLRKENAGLSQALAASVSNRISADEASGPTSAPASTSLKSVSLGALGVLQARYQADATNIDQELTKLDELRGRYTTNDPQFLDEKQKIEGMISVYQMLGAKIEAEKLQRTVTSPAGSH